MAISCWCMALCIVCLTAVAASEELELGSLRVVFQTKYGDIEFGFAKNVAPKTVEHIKKLVQLGAYNTNHFFRVDRGFVAQVADVVSGREAPLNAEQREEGEKTVVGEFSDVKHTKGILSMGRYSDPDSAGSSFSILLGDAPHLDKQYAIFGKVTKGYETLTNLEELPTRKEDLMGSVSKVACEDEVSLLKERLIESANNNQGAVQGLMMGIPVGCAIMMGVAWQRGWWHGTSKAKS